MTGYTDLSDLAQIATTGGIFLGAFGSSGNDAISGFNPEGLAEAIDGGSGNDTIYGNAGNDKYGANGADEIHGGAGNSNLFGGAEATSSGSLLVQVLERTSSSISKTVLTGCDHQCGYLELFRCQSS